MIAKQESQIKYLIFAICSTILAAVFLFLCLEVVLRIKGYAPFTYFHAIDESIVFEPDPILGWKNKPGIYTKWPSSWGDGKKIKVTIWPGGSRATAASRVRKDNQIIILGCSYMQGWALDDSGTFAWKLQENFPKIEISNYGISGYSTYQSLLLLEKYLNNSSNPPIMVLYGFAQFQSARNVAAVSHLKLVTRFSKRGHGFVPFCTIDAKGMLKRCLPVKYPLGFLDKHSAAINYLHTRYLTMLSYYRATRKEDVTNELLLEMNILCRGKGSKFVVLLLDDTKTTFEKKEYFSNNNISYIDCSIPKNTTFDLTVKKEGHPSSAVNSYWTDCVTKYLKKELFTN